MSKKYFSFLGPALQSYLELRQKLGYTSFRHDFWAKDFDHFLQFFGKTSLKDITEGDIVYWLHSHPKLSARSKNKRLSLIRGFFDHLIRTGMAHANPTKRIPFAKEKPFKPYIYSLQEIHRLLQQAAQYPGPLGTTLPVFFLLVYACGLRVGEAVHLKIQDVDFDQNLLALHNTKFHKERLIPFSTVLASRLKAYLAFRQKTFPAASPRAPFFCHINGPLSYSHLHTLFQRFVQQAFRIADDRVVVPVQVD